MDFCEIKSKPLLSKEEKDSITKPVNDVLNKRPDITFLITVVSIISFLVLIYFLYPYIAKLFGSDYLLTQDQYLKALTRPESSYSLQQLGKIKIEKESFRKYNEYFSSKPYSLQSQGLDDIARGVIFLPIISFLLIYIVPTLVVIYITWFIFTYWIYVIEALWGWFLMLYSYSTKLIECKLGEKWYISMVTGWHSCNPDFASYFNDWKKNYVDIPVYYEKLKYIKEYNDAKDKYITQPKINYITKPSEKVKVDLEFAKKTFIERTLDNFISKMTILYNNIYINPRNRIYELILEYNQKVTDNLSKYTGGDYTSTTTSGNPCTCNGLIHSEHKTDVDKILKNHKKDKENKEKEELAKKEKEKEKTEKEKEEKAKEEIIPDCVKQNISYGKKKLQLLILLLIIISIVIVYYREKIIINTFYYIKQISKIIDNY